MDGLRLGIPGATPKITMVPVPEWGPEVQVGVRCLTLAERLAYETEHGTLDGIDRKADPQSYNKWLITYVIAAACLPNGQRLFHPEDEAALAQQPATAIERL